MKLGLTVRLDSTETSAYTVTFLVTFSHAKCFPHVHRCGANYERLHPLVRLPFVFIICFACTVTPVFLEPTKWRANLGRDKSRLYPDCQVFMDFQREIHLSREWGDRKNLVSATDLPSWMRSTCTLELPRNNWRQRQLMQEIECTERRAVGAKLHAVLCTILLFMASIRSALLHLYIKECQTRACLAWCRTSVAETVGEPGVISALVIGSASDYFMWS